MADLDALRRLTAEMYLHTRNAPRTAQHAAASASHTAIRKAPVQRLAPAEQDARMRSIQTAIIGGLLNSPPSADLLREQLSGWQGARVR